MAPLPWWRRVLSRRDREVRARGPADGLRPASWSGTGPWPARVGGTGALRRNGDLFANSVRTCGRRGAGALRPGVSTYSLPCRSPPRGPCSFPRRFREARWNRRSEGGGSPVPAGTAKGSGSRSPWSVVPIRLVHLGPEVARATATREGVEIRIQAPAPPALFDAVQSGARQASGGRRLHDRARGAVRGRRGWRRGRGQCGRRGRDVCRAVGPWPGVGRRATSQPADRGAHEPA